MKLLLLLFFCSTFHLFSQDKVIKVACIGNSITEGHGISNTHKDSYPGILQQFLGNEYEVRNFGHSGRTLLNKGDNPYMHERMYTNALLYNPDIVTIKLGTNDSKPHNWIYKDEFRKDLISMIEDFQSLSSQPAIYLCLPAPAIQENYGINKETIANEIIPIIQEIAKKKKLKVIDLHTPLQSCPECFPDFVHPNEKGAEIIAREIYTALTGKDAPDYTIQKFPGEISQWEGYEKYDFSIANRHSTVVIPKKAAAGNPWIWRPAFFGAFPSVDIALLEKGFHVVYYDLTHFYGSPHAVQLGNEFYRIMVQHYHLSPKVTLEGFSRGGLFAFNWATANTDKVACIYVDAPVCNVFSWPYGQEPELWNDLVKEWNLSETEVKDFKGSPIHNLRRITDAKIPIISVCGDSDKTVPYEENMAIIYDLCVEAGSPVEVILKEGIDHHPHSLENPEPVVDFILRHQQGYKEYQHFTPRGNLKNSFLKFSKERKGTVAFLGGSITEMDGWRNGIQESLQQRFPYTQFNFIDAGIGSTGTTPGAFRLENDVLSKGDIDLLFIDAAVNDDTNGFSYIEQIRGMEGIVRHTLSTHPETDIVMLHFIYDPFIETIENGQIPDVILNHERVANHYMIPTVDMTKEITYRMKNGEFDWDTFGGTHPHPFGHKFYAATINELLDTMWKGIDSNEEIQPHSIPVNPLDPFCYSKGRFIDIKAALLGKGWEYHSDWIPKSDGSTRNGFVRVPMIESISNGSRLELPFTGTAIGIFCVAGPHAGMIEYSIDGSAFKQLDTRTEWSDSLYIPWVYMLETELEDTAHLLVLKVGRNKKYSEIQIRNFVVNGN